MGNSMTQTTGADRLSLLAYEEGCDPIAEGLRESIRTTMGAVFVAWLMKTGRESLKRDHELVGHRQAYRPSESCSRGSGFLLTKAAY